jgi:uncharacterized paraquat-inducible protein A
MFANKYYPYSLGRQPCFMQCPRCHYQIVTKTKQEISGCTLISMATLCVFYWPVFWLPVCFPCVSSISLYGVLKYKIPQLIYDNLRDRFLLLTNIQCQNTAHFCPRCGFEIGEKRNKFC